MVIVLKFKAYMSRIKKKHETYVAGGVQRILFFFRNSPRPNIYSVCYLCAIIAQMSMYLCVIIAQMSMYLCVIIAQMKQAEIHNT